MMKQANGVANDLQLQAVNAFTEAESLLEVMLKKVDKFERHTGDPFMLRAVIAGNKNINAARSIEVTISELLKEAVDQSENPFSVTSDVFVEPSGIFIQYEACFILFIEGYERYITHFLKLLEKHSEPKDTASFSEVRLLFLLDDVVPPVTPFFAYVDRVPAVDYEGEVQEKTDEEVADMIVEDVQNLMKLSNLVSGEAPIKRKGFLDNARVTHTLLFPSAGSIKMYLEKDLCLTLSEYVSVFGKVPELTRDIEMDHPVEDPLTY